MRFSASTIAQLHKLHDEIRAGRITRELLQGFLENPNNFVKDEWITVTVDYSRTLEEMIAAVRYDMKFVEITPYNFPLEGNVLEGNGKMEVKLRLVHLNREATVGDVVAYLDARGLKPAKLEHLLAFGETHPDLPRVGPIVALGSVWMYQDGNRFVPFTNWNGSKPDLNLGRIDPVGGWYRSCRFLATPK